MREPEQPTEQHISLVPETASDSAVRFLRAMIFSGELGPGDKLPPKEISAPAWAYPA